MKVNLQFFTECDEVENALHAALSTGNVSEAEQIVFDNENSFDGDISEVAFRIAVQENCYDYVEKHYEDVELNDIDAGCCSSYLHETDDEGIIDLLTSVGAYRNWEEFSDYKFAVETVNGSVLAFESDFQEEVFDKLLEAVGITREKLIEMFAAETIGEFDLPESLSDCDIDTLEDACNLLLVSIEEGEIKLGEFDYMDDSVQGWVLRELVEHLGWSCDFEGESWTFETNGVYYIE